ncbi:Het domain protein [Lasiodiplodia theobromae]|uniref:Het domain protein n=1 Tax=Lasiodiplodia theobromae TaxID=45133 RepID=UPI0015C31535|nr:Het domain protein [Lasiodiplodia theobromae]KAF4537847.1 Het domain protein [Lasiodiplodia theobromae]
MEHLFLDVSLDVGQEKILGALKDLPLKETDPQSKLTLVPPVKPFTRWFGYDHDAGAPLNNGEPHKPQPFWGYAKKRGWDLAPIFDKAGGHLARSHPSLQVPGMTCQLMSQRVAAFLQSWLYFGFIESFVWIPIHTSYLLRRDPATGYQYIHTGNLNFILMIFKALAESKDDLERKKKLTRASEDALNQVGEAIELVMEFARTVSLFPNSPFSELVGAIAHFLPSVIRLRDALLHARADAFLDEFHDRYLQCSRYPPYEEARRKRLLRRGWCPFLLTQYQQTAQSILDWLLECVRNNIDKSTYKIEHRSQYCACPFVKPNLDAVLDTIDNGKIPVMRVTRAGDEVKLDVAAHDPHSPETVRFVAISHVWVDGLGSTSENGLPSCQVIRLSESVASLTEGGDTILWMDSLCIPAAESQRKKAIGTMRKVYQNAAAVLVMDKTIAKTPKNAKLVDRYWAILSSSWAQRLWTFQEGYLAAKIFMQAAEGQLIEIRSALGEAKEIETRFTNTVVLWSFTNDMMVIRSTGSKTGVSFGEPASALSWRSTSRATDETIAIAALFDLDSDRLISIEGAEARMRAFFLMIRRIRPHVIFHGGPRLSAPGFRWAPATLLTRTAMFGETNGESDALCTEDGLLGRYFVLCLSGDPRPLVPRLTAMCHTDDGERVEIWGWDDTNTTPVVQSFNAVIFRAMQSEYKNPNQLPRGRNWLGEGVAVLLRDKVPGEDHRTCNFIGNVYLGSSTTQRPAWQGGVAYLKSMWMDLCIK